MEGGLPHLLGRINGRLEQPDARSASKFVQPGWEQPRVLRYEGHMLVYDPHTNGVGWVTMKRRPCLAYRSRGTIGARS